MNASHLYVGAWALGCFHGLISQYPNLSEGADRVGGQLRGDKECPFSGVTKCGRVWRKVPGSDARSVGKIQTPSTGLRHPPFNFGGRCRKAMLGVWARHRPHDSLLCCLLSPRSTLHSQWPSGGLRRVRWAARCPSLSHCLVSPPRCVLIPGAGRFVSRG